MLRREDRAIEHLIFEFLIHRSPFLVGRHPNQPFAGAKEFTAGTARRRTGARRGLRDEQQGRFVWARDLNRLAAVGSREEIGEVLLRVLGADLHGLRVAEWDGGVNGIEMRLEQRATCFDSDQHCFSPRWLFG